METNTNSLLRDFDTLEKTETTLEELRNSDDWEQALIVISEDTFPYVLPLESRTYLTTKGSPYFSSGEDAISGINLTFVEFNPRLDLYINGKLDITFKIEKCYKLWSVYDLGPVIERIRELTGVVYKEDEVEEDEVEELD